MNRLTKKEEVIMNFFWEKGPLFVRELRELYPEPRPHFSTLSTQVRTLQEEGFIDHKSYGLISVQVEADKNAPEDAWKYVLKSMREGGLNASSFFAEVNSLQYVTLAPVSPIF